MNRPKNQHWVPQFYLRHFATPDTCGKNQVQAWVFSAEEADGDETLPTLASDYMDLSDPALRQGVSLFVAVMHLRNPHTMSSIEEMHRALVAFYDEMPRRLAQRKSIHDHGSPDSRSARRARRVGRFACETGRETSRSSGRALRAANRGVSHSE